VKGDCEVGGEEWERVGNLLLCGKLQLVERFVVEYRKKRPL